MAQEAKSASKINIRELRMDAIKAELTNMGEQGYRAKQIYEWLWQKGARSFDEMSNLSKGLRDKLDKKFSFPVVSIHESQFSGDGTIKNTFQLFDKKIIEGVLIPAEDRMTACVSSQVGCSLTCKFCATGYMDRERNLSDFEIFDQVLLIAAQAEEHFKHRLTNIVYMGMGEPLLNYQNVLDSVDRITSPEGLDWSAKRITVSTAGIAKMIHRLGDDEVKFNLALSLHAANDAKRNKIMPINEQNSLESLKNALIYFYEKTGTRPTFEYIVFDKFNDELTDAAELLEFCRKVPSKVNIIEYNPIEQADFLNASGDKIEKFAHFLRERGVHTSVRRSRGKDIDAACGQLAVKQK